MDWVEVLKSDLELYSTTFPEDDISYQFRLLSMREYRLFNKLMLGGLEPPFFIYEAIFELCYFGTVEYMSQQTKMGYILSVGELIYFLSGSQNSNELLLDIAKERKRNPADSIFEHMRAVIISAIPAYSLKDVDNMTEKEFIKAFVISENILSKVNPEFIRLDLQAIYKKINGLEEEEEPKEEPATVQNDNEALKRALGHWKVQEAEELYRKDIESRQLSKEELEKLDKIRR
tara:strand:- start:434 stop:1129 length:696 start_codon:yes stop_codon:yes gene_type:complete